MGCEGGRRKTSPPEGIFIVTPSLEGSPTKAKEVPSPHEVRVAPVFQCHGVKGSGASLQAQRVSNLYHCPLGNLLSNIPTSSFFFPRDIDCLYKLYQINTIIEWRVYYAMH